MKFDSNHRVDRMGVVIRIDTALSGHSICRILWLLLMCGIHTVEMSATH